MRSTERPSSCFSLLVISFLFVYLFIYVHCCCRFGRRRWKRESRQRDSMSSDQLALSTPTVCSLSAVSHSTGAQEQSCEVCLDAPCTPGGRIGAVWARTFLWKLRSTCSWAGCGLSGVSCSDHDGDAPFSVNTECTESERHQTVDIALTLRKTDLCERVIFLCMQKCRILITAHCCLSFDMLRLLIAINGDASQLDMYRGITLSPTLSKLFESVLLETFEGVLNSDDLQFGFKKKTGCMNEWMNEWKCEDFKCVWKPTESRLCLTHYVNKSSRWAK